MSEVSLDGIESLHIVRADGNLTLVGGGQAPVEIEASLEPLVQRDGARAEITLRANATVRLPAGVALEVSECAGHLEVEDIAAPIVLGRVAGNARVRRIGALTLRNRIAGNARLERVGVVEGGEIAGTLRVERARSVSLRKVAGGFEAVEIELAAAIEKIGGHAFVEKIGGTLRAESVGGRLYAERVGEIDLENVGGKARIIDAVGNVRVGRVGGRAVVLGAGGDVKITTISGHALMSGVGGVVELPEVGGALDLRGPFPAGKFWGAQCRGRVSVEGDSAASLAVAGVEGWGRVRVL